MQGTAPRQVEMTNEFQEASQVPLLIAIDGEWGPAFRLKNTPRYPVQMALGAIQDDSLIYTMGREIGRQFRRMGVHINFAPVSDVNNNPNNPVINYRSFGENRITSYNVCYTKLLRASMFCNRRFCQRLDPEQELQRYRRGYAW